MHADIQMLALILDDGLDAVRAAMCEGKRGTHASVRLERVRDVLTKGIEAINRGRGRIGSGLDRLSELCLHVRQSAALVFGRNSSRVRHHIDGMLQDLEDHIESLRSRRQPAEMPVGSLRSDVMTVATSLRSVVNMLLSIFEPAPY